MFYSKSQKFRSEQVLGKKIKLSIFKLIYLLLALRLVSGFEYLFSWKESVKSTKAHDAPLKK